MDIQEFRYFGTWDYVLLVGMLLLSILIGVYFAFLSMSKTKQNTTLMYLMGGKTMGIFPVSMSLVASYLSAVALIGLPSEIYTYGTQIMMHIPAEIFATVIVAIVYIPVFYNLQVTSSYEYLNKRFSPTVRTMASALFLFQMTLYIPVVIYAPSLSFSQISGFGIDILIPVISIVCTFYTSLGGIKAVVWADTVQMMLMVLGAITIAIFGTHDVGGFQNVWETNRRSGRIEFFNMSWDPSIRHTFWNIVIGRIVYQIAICSTNQATVQRCLAMPTLKRARISIAIFTICTACMKSLCFYTGLVIYASFADCDPVTAGIVKKADQILPYYVMKVAGHVAVLPGIFASGIFSAALSSLSTGLNSMSGVILEDFIRPFHPTPLSEGRASFYMKIIAVLLGVVCLTLAFFVDKLGTIAQASNSLKSITAGTLLGLFTLGMLFPWANAKGAIAGGISSAFLVGWISFGSQLAVRNKQIVFPKMPVTIDGCDNATFGHYYSFSKQAVFRNETIIREEPFALYRVSYMYYNLIGVVTVIVVGMVVSYFTGLNDYTKMGPNVFSPVIHRFIFPCSKARIMEQKEIGVIALVPEAQEIPLLSKCPHDDRCSASTTLL